MPRYRQVDARRSAHTGAFGGKNIMKFYGGSSALARVPSFKTDVTPWVIEHEFPQRVTETSIVFGVPAEPRRTRFRRTDEEVREAFDRLRSDWSDEVGASSSLDERFMNWAHQRIIALGPQVLPLIIEDLRQTGELWFWALTALVGRDVAIGAETVEDAAKKWIMWAEAEGYVA